MKVRIGFVTNSSSASYLCVFARVNNGRENDMHNLLDKYSIFGHSLRILNLEDIKTICTDHLYNYLYSDTLGMNLLPSKPYLDKIESENPDSLFVILDDYCGDLHPGDCNTDPDFEESHDDPGRYVHDSWVLDVADTIVENRDNIFTDIRSDRKYGFDG